MKMTEIEELGRGFIEVKKKKKKSSPRRKEVTSLKLPPQLKKCQRI